MKLSAPKKGTWTLALVLGGAGLLGHFVSIPVISQSTFWLLAAAFILLVLGTYFKGL